MGTSGNIRPRIQRTRASRDRWDGKKLLLVEDDQYSIEYLKRLLSPTGIELHTANSGNDLEKYYDKLRNFDLVLLDIRLPDANGFDLMKQMKVINKQLPIIAQTAFAMEDDKTKCLDAGFDDYLAKPFSGEDILNLIHSYLGLSEKSS
jgi:CheY-like chemotaxis protein